MERYVQTRLPDGQISLEYSEEYEQRSEQETHGDVLDDVPEVSAAEMQLPHTIVTSSVDNVEDRKTETDDQSDASDSQTDIDEEEKEVLTEDEKKGLYSFFLL